MNALSEQLKQCKRCEQWLPLSAFYTHSAMSDGYLGFCKECTKRRIRRHRENNLDRIRAYDRQRAKLPHRTELSKKRIMREKALYPERYKARTAVSNAVRDKRIEKPEKCVQCGNAHNYLSAHHEDYSRPLDVIWLCPPCHIRLHCRKGEVA
jgi:hypothetical protein